MYKINLHAHSIYSDGSATVTRMAHEYKKQDFCSCVITDHVYSQDHDYSMNVRKFEKQLEDAKQAEDFASIPVIIGCEFSIAKLEECLVFGTEAIRRLLKKRQARSENGIDPTISIEDLRAIREEYDCAMILCHPMLATYDDRANFIESKGHEVIDGFEYINSGQIFFEKTRQVPEEFENLIRTCNSDAHGPLCLDDCWNDIDEDIKNENQLIRYIKDKKRFGMRISIKRRNGGSL